ncbi:MAG: hypothetical protein EOP56_04060 [Sphingobacteriales bacterium]|nr:MAG: hypothetical protein EOP56_04060 [Sphingobacteriales bacterium]
MRKVLLGLSFLALTSTVFVSCKKDKDPDPVVTPEDQLGYELKSDITTNRTLLSGKTYTMTNMVYVKNGATLTIEPGAIIKVAKGKNALVVTRGAKIVASGTAENPIVFTSNEGTPSYGDWGGIVILGKATTNASFNQKPGEGEIEGGVNNSAGDGLYGGTDDGDNSGVLKYVRIEYGGYAFQPDKELNSLTLGAVGSGTQIDYVQCSYGLDDAFEMFGGTVNLKHIIAYKGLDDDFDCDNGYRGTVQFAIAVRDANKADISGSNGFEQDNDASGSTTTPITAPVFANVTLIGPKQDANTTIHKDFKRAAHLRRNTRTSIFNSILMGYPTGILVDGSKAAQNLIDGQMELKGLVIAGMGKSVDTAGTTSMGFNLTERLTNADWKNEIKSSTADAGLTAAYGAGASFDPTPASGSIATSGAVTVGKGSVTSVNYRGAVGAGDTWWKGWTKF